MKYLVKLLLPFILKVNPQVKYKSVFEVLVKVKSTAPKGQQSSGICRSFATTSFIETEALRLAKDVITLSLIFYLKPTYLNKAAKFIETKGKTWFDTGDLSFCVIDNYIRFGAIPEQVYNGIIDRNQEIHPIVRYSEGANNMGSLYLHVQKCFAP